MSEPLPEKWFQALCEIQTRTLDKFTASVERFMVRDETDHREFREAIATMAVAVELLRAQQIAQRELMDARHKEKERRWGRVWAVVVAPVLAAILLAILSLVLRGGS